METNEAKRIRELEALLDEAFGQIDFWRQTADRSTGSTMPMIRPSLSVWTRLRDAKNKRPVDFWQPK